MGDGSLTTLRLQRPNLIRGAIGVPGDEPGLFVSACERLRGVYEFLDGLEGFDP
jgi:hypothetical protein